jgi:sec-independent protein translocase protein TatB
VFNLGMGEITVILLLALIFLGPSKLPDLAAGLGKLIKEIRKATSDVKNEIALDDSFRKPFEELRDAVTLHPDELKRRDQWAKEREEAARRAAEEAAREAAATEANNGLPPDGLADNVKLTPEQIAKLTDAKAAAPKLPEPNGPNATIVQPSPRGATLDDVPTPPPEMPLPPVPAAAASAPSGPNKATAPATPQATGEPGKSLFGTPDAETKPVDTSKPLFSAPGGAPAGTVARGGKPATAAPTNGDATSTSNVTQLLKEEDLIPAASSGTPPPPPHLPGLRPAGAPRPPAAAPPPTPPRDDKKKA